MQQQVLFDKLSEFLAVEQGGVELYRLALARSTKRETKSHYQEYLEQTMRHREVLVRLIERLGGDPDYVSPTARLSMYKGAKLMESCLAVDSLSQEEIEANDLENLLLAETKDHADWELLSQLARELKAGDVGSALQEALAEVEPQEDEHLEWARETLAELNLRLVMRGPAPSPERWQQRIYGPEPPIESIHPSPLTTMLLEHSNDPQWQPTPISQSLGMNGGAVKRGRSARNGTKAERPRRAKSGAAARASGRPTAAAGPGSRTAGRGSARKAGAKQRRGDS